ncbi:hypothetical protein [Acidithrix ferrooxidans]|uniref:hypothetical protein n=1 Tax=Acidithrix ferrooxidans TaxID=1280514 RepID=UPI0006969569|nr:hypothetical protein [Acidithrix ferrooxidans]
MTITSWSVCLEASWALTNTGVSIRPKIGGVALMEKLNTVSLGVRTGLAERDFSITKAAILAVLGMT